MEIMRREKGMIAKCRYKVVYMIDNVFILR